MEVAAELNKHFDLTIHPADSADQRDIPRLIRGTDVVIAQETARWALHAAAGRKQVILDWYAPMFPETYEHPWRRRSAWTDRALFASLRLQASTASVILCASERQRDLYTGMAAAWGLIPIQAYERDKTLDSIFKVVPFGVPNDPPKQTRHALKGAVPGVEPEDLVLIWAGGVYDWFDPTVVIKAMEIVRRQRADVKLVFLGLNNPESGQAGSARVIEARATAAGLGLLDSTVIFNGGWVPYDDRHNYLMDADIGVVSAPPSIENRYSFRTRVLDYFWAGLPVLTSPGDVLASVVAGAGCGAAMATRTPEAWASEILKICGDSALRRGMAKRSLELAAAYRWSTVLRPLVEACETASVRPGVGLGRAVGGFTKLASFRLAERLSA